jgi:hypothetical protein
VARLNQVIQIDEGKIQAHLGEVSEAERNWSTLAVQFAPRLSLFVRDFGPVLAVKGSPRNNSAPLTAAGRSKKPPLSKRDRLKTERDQTAANLDLFFTATDREKWLAARWKRP